MTQPLRPEPLLRTLVDHEVGFIVVGGYAVAAHGYVRATKDIDICPDPDPGNLQRLTDALEELEAKPIGLDDFEAGEFDLQPNFDGLQYGGNWTLHTNRGRLDVLQHIQGLGTDGGGCWAELAAHAVTREFLGHECLFCSYEDLLKMKRAAGRPQDEIDIASLKAARGEA
jgi:hypothetical protein